MSDPIKFRFELGDRIGVEIGSPRGAFYRFQETVGDIHRFEREDAPGVDVTFTDAALTAFEKTRGWRYNSRWYTPAEAAARQACGVDCLTHLPKKTRKMMIVRTAWMRAIEHARYGCNLPLNADTIRMLIEDKKDEVLNEVKCQLEKQRVGKKIPEIDALPDGRTIWRWWSQWVDGGRRFEAMRPKYFLRPVPLKHQWAPEVEVLIRSNVDYYASEKRPTQDFAYETFKSQVEALNKGRPKDDQFDRPGETSFKARIRANGKFANCAGREGVATAIKQFPFVTDGLDVTVPGQRIELDGWEIHLQALLMEAEVWEALDDELKKEVKRTGRYILCVAIDATTRVILGMAIDATETNELAIRVLNMVCRDKKPFAEAAGAKTPWCMRTGINEIATDMKFTDDEFHWRVEALRGSIVHPAAGRAADRARIERCFKSLDNGLLGNFTGRTFSNPQMLGEYKAEKRASLTVETFCRVVTRYVIDIYHNLRHEGLNLETPFNAWRRTTQIYGIKRPPDSELLRNVFGLHFERDISTKGIRFMNIYYQSLELHEVLKQGEHVKDIDIIVDPDDLGAISVKIGKVYVTVLAPREKFNRVKLEDWIATCANLHARFGEEAKIAEEVVFAALRDIQEIAAESERSASIGPTSLTPYEVERAERRLTIAWKSKQAGEANANAGGDILAGALPALPAPSGIEVPPAAALETPVDDNKGNEGEPTDQNKSNENDKPIDPRDDAWGFED